MKNVERLRKPPFSTSPYILVNRRVHRSYRYRFALVGQSFLLAMLVLPASLAFGQATASSTAPGPTWLPLEDAVSAAEASGKKVLVDIYAPWCGWCRKMQAEVYTVPELLAYVNKHFETGRLNIDATEDTLVFKGYTLTSAQLATGLGAEGTPTTVFLDPKGDYITRLPGYVEEDDFMQVLRFIGTDAYREHTFQEFMAQEQGQEEGR